jgi:glycerol uptake facilitator protein
VTLGLAAIGKFGWENVPGYIVAQVAGGFLGGLLVYLAYLPHWPVTESKGDKLAVFSTGPAIRHTMSNLLCEAIGTAMLVLGLLAILTPANLVPNSGFDKGFAPVIVGMLVGAIGLSLGGPTGYAINPARDLGPRLAHLVLPIPGKGSSDWGYAWIPVVGPIIGGIAGALVYKALWAAA